MRTLSGIIGPIVLVVGAGHCLFAEADAPSRPLPESAVAPSIERVWALEESYWRYVRDGDVAGYLELWNDRFVGWPCANEHPATKDTIAHWVEEIRNEHIQFTYALNRERAVDFGEVVVVYYSTPMIRKYADGRVTGGAINKFTHTWLRVGSTWQIIGGMCAAQKPI
jgi:hypothetical protein